MKKHLLIFSWEYYGYHSAQGTALAKRPCQVAESFNANGWDVTVIHKDHREESNNKGYFINIEVNGIKRIAVKINTEEVFFKKSHLLRKIETLYYTAFHGDRSYKWSNDVINHFSGFNIGVPNLIISFFTPRVTLYLGNYFSKKFKVSWIADLQDPIYEGVAKNARLFCRYWMRYILKSACSIVHVSPEWAKDDAEKINKKIATIRHAIPERITNAEHTAYNDNIFRIFYGGSIDPNLQSLWLLKKVISSVSECNNVQVFLAGNMNAYTYFKKELGDELVKYLGWLNIEEMNQIISTCNCTLVVGWSKTRIGIPSKFYELCAYDKPIWIIGEDIEAFSSLFSEWKHSPIEINNQEYQKKALVAAIKQEYSYMFDIKDCKGKYVSTKDLYGEYIQLCNAAFFTNQ